MRAGKGEEATRMLAQLCSTFDRSQYAAFREGIMAFSAAAENSYLQNRLEPALAYQRAALELAMQLEDDELVHQLDEVDKLMRGDWHTTELQADAGQGMAAHIVPTVGRDAFIARKIQLLTAAGKYDLAWREVQANGIQMATLPAQPIHYRLAAYLWASIGRGVELEVVAPLLENALAYARQHGHRLNELQFLVLSAWLEWKLGRADWTQALAEAEQLASETGYVRFLLDVPDINSLRRETYPVPAPVHRSASSRPLFNVNTYSLTEQERRVLELLAADYTYQQIAAELVVSINTVRTHVRHVYEKLNVSRRDQAIAAVHGTAIRPS